ncbi:hypothetical protein Tco_1475157 [Tanacetum coccineum]
MDASGQSSVLPKLGLLSKIGWLMGSCVLFPKINKAQTADPVSNRYSFDQFIVETLTRNLQMDITFLLSALECLAVEDNALWKVHGGGGPEQLAMQ